MPCTPPVGLDLMHARARASLPFLLAELLEFSGKWFMLLRAQAWDGSNWARNRPLFSEMCDTVHNIGRLGHVVRGYLHAQEGEKATSAVRLEEEARGQIQAFDALLTQVRSEAFFAEFGASFAAPLETALQTGVNILTRVGGLLEDVVAPDQ